MFRTKLLRSLGLLRASLTTKAQLFRYSQLTTTITRSIAMTAVVSNIHSQESITEYNVFSSVQYFANLNKAILDSDIDTIKSTLSFLQLQDKTYFKDNKEKVYNIVYSLLLNPNPEVAALFDPLIKQLARNEHLTNDSNLVSRLLLDIKKYWTDRAVRFGNPVESCIFHIVTYLYTGDGEQFKKLNTVGCGNRGPLLYNNTFVDTFIYYIFEIALQQNNIKLIDGIINGSHINYVSKYNAFRKFAASGDIGRLTNLQDKVRQNDFSDDFVYLVTFNKDPLTNIHKDAWPLILQAFHGWQYGTKDQVIFINCMLNYPEVLDSYLTYLMQNQNEFKLDALCEALGEKSAAYLVINKKMSNKPQSKL